MLGNLEPPVRTCPPQSTKRKSLKSCRTLINSHMKSRESPGLPDRPKMFDSVETLSCHRTIIDFDYLDFVMYLY